MSGESSSVNGSGSLSMLQIIALGLGGITILLMLVTFDKLARLETSLFEVVKMQKTSEVTVSNMTSALVASIKAQRETDALLTNVASILMSQGKMQQDLDARLRSVEDAVAICKRSVQDWDIRLSNMESILQRTVGDILPIKTPGTFTHEIAAIKAQVENNPAASELPKIQDSYNSMLKKYPQWVLEKEYSDLRELSIRIHTLYLLHQSEEDPSVENLRLLSELDGKLSEEASLSVAETYKERIEKVKETVRNSITARQKKAFEDIEKRFSELNSLDPEDYRGLVNELDSYAADEAGAALIDKVEKKISELTLLSRLADIDKTLKNPPSQNLETQLEYLGKLSSDIIQLTDAVMGQRNDAIKNKFGDLIKKIEDDTARLGEQITAHAQARINDYNIWALNTLTKFKEEAEAINKRVGVVASHMQNGLSKDEAREQIFSRLTANLFQIDQSLLLEPVRDIYTKTYSWATSVLGEDYGLQLAKKSASIKRRPLRSEN